MSEDQFAKDWSEIHNLNKMDDYEFLKNLAERLRDVPTFYGTDEYDIDRLIKISYKKIVEIKGE